MQAIVLSAGKGNRLKPFTNIRSKAMAPILNKPIVHRVMETFWENDITNFIVVKSPDDKHIVNYLMENKPKNVNINFVTQNNRDGTVGAVLCAKKFVKSDFIISACDSLKTKAYVSSFIDHFSNNSHHGIVATMKADEKSITKSSAVEVDDSGYIKTILEKPSIQDINTDNLGLPLYAFRKTLFRHFHEVTISNRGEKEIQDFINIVIKKYGKVLAHPTSKRHTITTVEDLLNLNKEFFKTEQIKNHNLDSFDKDLKIIQPVIIDDGFSYGHSCVVGPNVVIEKNVKIGNKVKISNSLVLSDSTVPNNTIIDNEVYFTDGS